MFEDATFASTGRIATHNPQWMGAAFCLDAAIVATFLLIPLVVPQALPIPEFPIHLFAPPAPPVAPVEPKPAQAAPSTQQAYDPYAAPRSISKTIYIAKDPEPPSVAMVNIGAEQPVIAGAVPGYSGHPRVVIAQSKPAAAPVHVTSSVIAGMILLKTVPRYPAIAQAAHQEGTVELAATISATGTIENLRVVGGPVMLRQAALEAVATWRYRPYLLNGEPVEVETTINVNFFLQH